MPDKYLSCLDNAKYFAIVSRGCLAFRFGPMSGPEAGKIMEQCSAEGVPLLVTADCGPVFDWELARDIRGYPDGDPRHEEVLDVPTESPAAQAVVGREVQDHGERHLPVAESREGTM